MVSLHPPCQLQEHDPQQRSLTRAYTLQGDDQAGCPTKEHCIHMTYPTIYNNHGTTNLALCIASSESQLMTFLRTNFHSMQVNCSLRGIFTLCCTEHARVPTINVCITQRPERIVHNL